MKKLTHKADLGKVSKALLITRKALPNPDHAITQSITNTFITLARHIFFLFPSNQIKNTIKCNMIFDNPRGSYLK